MSIQSERAGIRERVNDNGTTTCPTGRAGPVLPVEREPPYGNPPQTVVVEAVIGNPSAGFRQHIRLERPTTQADVIDHPTAIGNREGWSERFPHLLQHSAPAVVRHHG